MFRERLSGLVGPMGGEAERLARLRAALEEAEAVVIGAGAGLSTSAGFVYNGERFHRYFGDFEEKYGFYDMYAGGFYPFPTAEERWAFWSRNIYINRFVAPPRPVYNELLALVKDKDYFVLTTNVDHQFQKAGFDKQRLFYTQGDYGLWQCSSPCHKRSYDNKDKVVKMLLAQGFLIGPEGALLVPETEKGETDFTRLSMSVPSALIPYCPVCGEPMSMNLRGDDTFVEDAGWHAAAERYSAFLQSRQAKKLLFLELGVGGNTPGIIKYPFWRMTEQMDRAVYACVNRGEACCPERIADRAVCIDGDIGALLTKLLEK